MITAKLIFNVDGYIPRHLPPPFASAGAAGNMKDSTCVGSQVTPFHLRDIRQYRCYRHMLGLEGIDTVCKTS